MYQKEFLDIITVILEKGVFPHSLYIKGQPTKILLSSQEKIMHLLNGTFLHTYRVMNGCLDKYENVEVVKKITAQEIIDTCSSYFPIPEYERAPSLSEYLLNPTNRYSRFIDDLINPGFLEAKNKVKFTKEEEIIHIVENNKKDYQRVIKEFPDNILTKKRFVVFYQWWFPHKDNIWRFADASYIYQQSFTCFLQYWFTFAESIADKQIKFNLFGITGGKYFESFLDFCERKGYHLKYDKDSWILPENRRIER